MSSPLKIVFAGTPDFSAAILSDLVSSKHTVLAAYTQPDRKAGRGKKLNQSPVKKLALEHNIQTIQPSNFKDQVDIDALINLKPDIMIVVAYGILLPQCVLDIPKFGCINIHASLLPKWRGAAPIERSLLAGDTTTGITIMQMDKGLDTGDMLDSIAINITDSMTSLLLHDQLIPLASKSLISTLDTISSGGTKPVKQNDDDSSYAVKLEKSEGLIDWSQPCESIHRKIRGLNPRPIAFSYLNDQAVRIWEATYQPFNDQQGAFDLSLVGSITDISKNGISVYCGDGGVVIIQSLQLPGGKQLQSGQIVASKKAIFYIGNLFSNIKPVS